jgi:uncharacterized phage infection (PIP) family protein YhgE
MSSHEDHAQTVFGIQSEMGKVGNVAANASEHVDVRTQIIDQMAEKLNEFAGLAGRLALLTDGGHVIPSETFTSLDGAKELSESAGLADSASDAAQAITPGLDDAKNAARDVRMSVLRINAAASNIKPNVVVFETSLEMLRDYNNAARVGVKKLGETSQQVRKDGETYLEEI